MLILNDLIEHGKPLAAEDARAFGGLGASEVLRLLTLCPIYSKTPLLRRPALACKLGISSLDIKDESQRLGLGSFKALGGGYAVIRVVLEEAGKRGVSPSSRSLTDPAIQKIARSLTVACATDGNHGRSVATAARLVGCNAVIFIHSGVSAERAGAIARSGAKVVRVAGTYDDAVRESASACKESGWILVSDMSWPGYERIPTWVMQGYTVLAHEVLDDLTEPPTHVFLQAGVGGFAAVIAAHLSLQYESNRPKFVIVEPERAACLYRSAVAARRIRIEHSEPTIMAMLECYEPSLIAWRILARTAFGFMTVGEGDAVDAMRKLATPTDSDPAVIAGESGGAGLAGLTRAASDPRTRISLGLDGTSRVLLFNTEGVTDASACRALIGPEPKTNS